MDEADNWNRVSLPDTLSRLAFGNGTFVGVGISTFTSGDGLAWTKSRPFGSPIPSNLAFGGDSFVAVGGSGGIYTSTTGTNWTSRGWGGGNSFLGVTEGGGVFVVVGAPGKIIFTSIDAVNWTGRDSGSSSYSLFAVAYGANSFVAVGEGGSIFQSGDLPPERRNPTLSVGFYPGLTIRGQAGRTYRIESTDSLNPANWRTLATPISPASEFFWTDFESVNRSNRFYRVELIP